MATKRLTPAQRIHFDNLVEITATEDVARFVPRQMAGYSETEIRRVDSKGFETDCAWMTNRVFNALCAKGALAQVMHPTRPGVCIGYVVAPGWL